MPVAGIQALLVVAYRSACSDAQDGERGAWMKSSANIACCVPQTVEDPLDHDGVGQPDAWGYGAEYGLEAAAREDAAEIAVVVVAAHCSCCYADQHSVLELESPTCRYNSQCGPPESSLLWATSDGCGKEVEPISRRHLCSSP